MWKRGKRLALEQHDASSLLRDQRRHGRSRRTAANDDDICLHSI